MAKKEFKERTDPEKLFIRLYGKNVSPIPIKLFAKYVNKDSGMVGTEKVTDRQIAALIVVLLYSSVPFAEGTVINQRFSDHANVTHILENGCTDDMIKSGLVTDEGGEWGDKSLRLTNSASEEINRFLKP